MTYSIETIVPLGRSYDEYVDMFALTPTELCGRILGCADGPASFNAIHSSKGGHIVSVDPLYDFSINQIRDRIKETFTDAMNQVRSNQSEFVWNRIRSVDELEHVRMEAMNQFLDDYSHGKANGRYVPCGLPDLPFDDGAFDLALCSHYLFLYSAQLSTAYHIRSIKELCRVAAEVRIYPLLEFGSVPSRHLDAVIANLRDSGHACWVDRVLYQFQRGDNEMLRVCGA